MREGLRPSEHGEDVRRLHKVLAAAGHSIDDREVEGAEFGASTLAALHAFQAQQNLPETDVIDEQTLALLVVIEQNITINIDEGTSPPPPPPPDPRRGIVRGNLVDGDGAPIAQAEVALFSVRVRGEARLNRAATNAAGRFTLHYERPKPLNLVVRAYDTAGNVTAASPTQFAAAVVIEVDITTAPDGIVRTPSLFTALVAAVNAGLDGTPFLELQENDKTHELTFLASTIGMDFTDVAYLYIAELLAQQNGLQPQTLFGFFVEGVPPTLKSALGALPDAGIDSAFTGQVMTAVLGQPDSTLGKTLTAAVAANILPASYAAAQAAEISRIDALRVTSVGSTPYIRGKTSLNDLLAAGAVAANVQTAFVQAYAASGGNLGPTWTALRADKTLSKDDLTALNNVLGAGELLTGNVLLTKDALQRLAQGTLASLSDLALLDEADWQARITALDPNAATIPQVLPNDTPADRIARFAKALAHRIGGRYATTAFRGNFSKATTSSFATKTEMIGFLTANPKFNFHTTNVDQFVATNKLTVSAPAVAELKTAQRLFRLSPHYTSVEALNASGYTSAQSIYFKGRAPFVAAMTGTMGSAALANMAFARAQMTYATALMAFGRYTLPLNGVRVAGLATPQPDPTTIVNLPDLQALFGSLDYFQCEDCQSVYSPAAYLVDLLQYLSWFTATPLPGTTPPISTIATARDALLLRRPDIEYVALSCDNTNTTIPYIDLVNEILEAAIAPTGIPRPTWVDTEGTTAERLALPQQTQPAVSAAAYAATQAAVYPLSLPFDVNFTQTAAFIAALGTKQSTLMSLFPGTATPAAIAGAAIGVNPGLQAVINQVDTTSPWTRWGLAQHPAVVIDPGTFQPYSPTPADWVAALNKVPLLMSRAGLTLQQLYQLLEVVWVTQSGVTLQAGTIVQAGVPILSASTDLMVFTGLTGDVLDRANRFLRLWNATGLQMWELDWALEQAAGGVLDDTFLIFLAGAMAVRTQLSLPFQEVLTFYAPIKTRDVTSHLGDQDTVVPSTYTEVFASPTVLASWSSLFGNPAALPGVPIVYPASDSPNPGQLQPLNGINAALGLSATDISAILAATGAANALTLPTLTALFRYARLASALSLAIPDLVLWIELTAGKPFGGTPADTIEFLRRLALLRGTTIAVHDLDYLLRGQSASQSALAFTPAQATAVLQSVRDAVAKAIAASQLTLTQATNAAPIAVTTVKPHGLATGTEVFITGVQGNTAADGSFTITVDGPSGFTLDGSAGNGGWTGGGTATANLDSTLQAIAVAALAAATGVTADVVTPVLARTGALPLSASTITQLLAQPTVDPTQFPTVLAAFTQVANAGALYTALSTNTTAFAFLVANAATFGWLDPSALPLAPVAASPYAAFEALLRALALQKRQAARSPKLFDVLGQWLLPGQLPTGIQSAIGGPAIDVAGATDTSPIAITTTAPHALATGAQVAVSLVQGNTAANGTYTVTVTGPAGFTLDGSVGNGAYAGGGVVTALGVPALAAALNATIADTAAMATVLGATPPTLPAAPGTLTDMAMLTSIANALDVVSRYGIDGPMLVLLAAAAPGPDNAAAAMAAFQAQYSQQSWLAAVQPVENTLRQARRDALVAYLLGPGPQASPGAQFLTTDDIFNYYLIDPEMCACGQTTRLLQPSLAIQQFVQQCFLNLTINATVDTTNSNWSEWSWRQQYRLWQANREVFLYPENYVLPQLRTNASPFFSTLESNLQQTNCDASAAEAAFETYLRSLVGVARLVVAAHYNQVNSDGSQTLYVFARTHGAPYQWWYRTRTIQAPTIPSMAPPSGVWGAWTSLGLDIAADQVMPTIWDRRLYLIWPIFKQISETQSSQKVPSSGGGSQAPAQKFWSVQIAMSEFSAGQWQAKYTFDEKLYINTEDPPKAFMFKAYQDASFNLQIEVYWTDQSQTDGYAWYLANGTISIPEAPLSWTELSFMVPPEDLVDQSQEPSYTRLQTSTGALVTPDSLWIEPTPNFFAFENQDLVYGGWSAGPPSGEVPVWIMNTGSAKALPGSLELLGKSTNPRIVVPQQEMIFDSADPFFVADPSRTYLVQPHYYTISSSPQELENLTYVNQWSTRYEFRSHYHPYARTFLRELEIGGVPQLMSRTLQTEPQKVRGWPTTFDFNVLYAPQPPVAKPFPGTAGATDPGETALDFDPGCSGAYSLYNWEIFYHGPMYVAAQLMQNQQFQDAMSWYNYIFNPSDNSGGPTPQRFWEFAPFYQMNAADWVSQEIQNLLTTLAVDTQQGISDPATQNAIAAWMNDPYDPHMVASMRISAYAKATVMQFLNNLIAWGDSLYAQYTAEMVSQAEQLYIIADMILGPAPDQIRLPSSQQQTAPTYASLKNIDMFSNVLVKVENLILAPEPSEAIVQGTAKTPSLPQFPGNGNTLLFCIPPNDQLLAYWGTVAQRLYNIRNCLNLHGVAQPLPLYAPPINPLQLIAEKAAGASSFGAASTAPIYRFATYLQKAVDLTNDVRAYGNLILAALEKQDAETLAALRATQEVNLQTTILDVKQAQVQEAQDEVIALQNQLAVVQVRYQFYSTVQFINTWEATALALQGAALIANAVGLILDMTAGVAHLVPSVTGGAAGFGGSPLVTVTYGGEQVGDSAAAWATVARAIGGLLSQGGGMAATMGSYQRRQDDWTMQANLASAEMTQVNSQITAAQDRVTVASNELSVQNLQITNAQAISDFLTNKYTNAQLYSWMVSQLTTVYTQAYQLAYSLALQAQAAYQYELGRPTDQFIQFAYWNSQYKGLTAGDSLLFDLRRMEAQYIANNVRELELTKHFSLALMQPLALVQLLETGTCTVSLDETLFDFDHPGQYFRRLRSVAVTIPCVTGPYTGVNATLSLGASVVRTVAPVAGFQPWIWANAASNTDPAISASPTVSASPVIATSSGQADAGLFEVSLRDERWLPFEGQGAVCQMILTLDPRDNNFDISSVTDVVLHLRYSARFGGDADAVRAALKPANQRSILVSTRNTFGDAYYSFFHPTDTTATQQTLTLPFSNAVFPYSNLGVPDITHVTVLMVFAEPMTAALSSALGGAPKIAGTFGPSSSATLGPVALQAIAGTAPGGGPIGALSSGDIPLAPPTHPASFTLTIPQASIPTVLQTVINGQTLLDGSQISDIVLLISYTIG